ncbi:MULTISPECIES: hypothetical protein [unclassified Oceanobacter]|uniref:hypothetical protein n=1 Tax=unclassified Oceanobacter TaxID=2620260 RepID=UPI002733B331|nr:MULTISPECIES: hypothetical protein [unclassified Oceanobacter]MDP2609174.1 hypothetical protein [Oceanobacter sp. 1_MG-2023]MDP2612534.1 hypothetical protein [Oceanobacter sp. 2_MG-2023]
MTRSDRASWAGSITIAALSLQLVPAQALTTEPYLRAGQEALQVEETDTVEPSYESETLISGEMVERSREWLANHLDNLSGGLDSFFVDTFFSEDIFDDDVKGSRAKLSLYTRRELGDPVDYKFGISVNLELPHISERLNLLLESEEEEAREADPLESIENNNYSAALRFILQESERWKTNIDAGIRWGLPPDPFVRLRARRYSYFAEWEMKATQNFSYFASEGWGEYTSVQMNYPLNIEKLFRVNAKASYLLNDDYFKLSYSGGLYHELSQRAALGYVAGASGDTEASASFYNYSVSVRYRRQIYQDWVFAELAPELVWERDKDYETTPVIMFRIESVISK